MHKGETCNHASDIPIYVFMKPNLVFGQVAREGAELLMQKLKEQQVS